MAGPKDPFEAPELEDILLLYEYNCEGSDRGGEFVRGKPREVVDALMLLRADTSVGATEEPSVLGDGANTREL